MAQKSQRSPLKHTTYILSCNYFVHAKYKDFKGRIYSLCKSDVTPGQYILLCYRFEEMEHVSPCKKACMRPSTLKKIKKKLKSGKSS